MALAAVEAGNAVDHLPCRSHAWCWLRDRGVPYRRKPAQHSGAGRPDLHRRAGRQSGDPERRDRRLYGFAARRLRLRLRQYGQYGRGSMDSPGRRLGGGRRGRASERLVVDLWACSLDHHDAWDALHPAWCRAPRRRRPGSQHGAGIADIRAGRDRRRPGHNPPLASSS